MINLSSMGEENFEIYFSQIAKSDLKMCILNCE